MIKKLIIFTSVSIMMTHGSFSAECPKDPFGNYEKHSFMKELHWKEKSPLIPEINLLGPLTTKEKVNSGHDHQIGQYEPKIQQKETHWVEKSLNFLGRTEIERIHHHQKFYKENKDVIDTTAKIAFLVAPAPRIIKGIATGIEIATEVKGCKDRQKEKNKQAHQPQNTKGQKRHRK